MTPARVLTIFLAVALAGCGDDAASVTDAAISPRDAAGLDSGVGPATDGGGSGDAGDGPRDAGGGGGYDGGAGPPTGCMPARLTYYDVVGAGACEVMDVASALPRIARDGFTTAIGEPWWGGSLGGDPAEACGECWELTTASATQTVVVTDLCPIAGNPLCAGEFFHFDVAHTAAGPLGYETAGIVQAAARRVPCPVEGNVFAVIRDQNPWFIRLALADVRVAIRAVDYRGAGAGVAADNPWTAMHRDGGAWAVTSSGTMLARGGTGVVLRITTAQGQVVESAALIASGAAPRTAVDLGVQVDDLAAPTGSACGWRPPDPYVDGLGGIPGVAWRQGGWGGGMIDVASTTGCRAGSCIRVAGLDGWGGVQLYYNQPFPWAGLSRLTLSASAPTDVPLELKLLGEGGAECVAVDFTAGAAFGRVELDLATACGGAAEVATVQVQLMRAAAGDFVLDDIVFE